MSNIKDWKKEIFTIPNLLSLFRLTLIPVYIIIYLKATELYQHFISASILAVSCMTDMIDGKIARHFNMISTVGKVLDPLADKLTQFALTICLSIRYPILRAVVLLFFIKEVYQLVLGIIYLRKGMMLPGALLIGKICTTILFVSLIVLVLFPMGVLPESCVSAIALVDSIFLIASFIGYTLAYFGRNAKIKDVSDK